MTLNSNEPTLDRHPSNVFPNSSTTAMSKPSKFYKNGRNPESCNTARLFWYSAVCSISFKNDGSFLTGAMFKFSRIPCHNLKRILVSDTNSCWEFYVGGPSILCPFSPIQPIMFNDKRTTPWFKCRYVSSYYGWEIMIGCGGGLCNGGVTVIMIKLGGMIMMDKWWEIGSKGGELWVFGQPVLSHGLPYNSIKTYFSTHLKN